MAAFKDHPISKQTEQFIVKALLKARGGKGCMLVGDPEYYKRFGFKNMPVLIHPEIPQEVFLVLPFGETVAHGTVMFHKGFMAKG